jgi:hypothetical protein
MAAEVVRHSVKTAQHQTVRLAQPAHTSHAKPATDDQIADATGPHRPQMAPASHVTTPTSVQLALVTVTQGQPATANAVRSTHAHHAMALALHLATATVVQDLPLVMVSDVHSATALSAMADALHLVTATAVHARLLAMVSAVNGLLAQTAATSVRVTTDVTTVALVMVLAPKSAQAAAPLATVRVPQRAANTVAAMLRVTASAVTA